MRLGRESEKEGMLRAPGDLRSVKIRPARPSASSELWQVPRNPRTHPSVILRKPKNYPGNGTGRAPDVVAKAAARGAGPASRRGVVGASWEVRWHHRDVAGPGEVKGERGGPEPRTTLLPVFSLPAPLLSLSVRSAGLGGPGSVSSAVGQ